MLVPSLGYRVISGAIIIVISLAAKWLDTHAEGNKFWQSITFHESRTPMCSMLYCIQVNHFLTFITSNFGSSSNSSIFLGANGKQIFLVGVSSVMVFLSTKHRTQNQELHSSHQFINWLVAGISSDLCSVCVIVFLCV